MEKRQKSSKLVFRIIIIKSLIHLSNFTTLVYAPAKRTVYKTFTVKILKNIPVKSLVIPGEILQILKKENPNLKGDFNFRPKNKIYRAKNLDLMDNGPLLPSIKYLNLINIIFSRFL